MNILVTGGAGFLGLHIAHYLAKKKKEKNSEIDRIIFIDIAPFDPQEYPKDIECIRADVRDKKEIHELLKGVDVVIHAAAALPLWKKELILDTNVNGTGNMLRNAQENNVKRFIYISSTAVYGVPKKHPVLETDPLVGVGPYGQSKIDAEELCRKYRRKGLNVVIIRPKTFLGTHRLGVFEILFDWIKDGKRIPVIGNGNNRYQLLEVDDLVEAIYLFATHRDAKAVNSEFNIGAERFLTVQKDMQELFNVARSGSRVYTTPARPIKTALYIFEKLGLSPLYQWVYDTADKDSFVSIDKLTKTLNWHPRHSNGQALIKAYEWYVAHYSEIKARTPGVTHTVGWKQGILGVFKRFL